MTGYRLNVSPDELISCLLELESQNLVTTYSFLHIVFATTINTATNSLGFVLIILSRCANTVWQLEPLQKCIRFYVAHDRSANYTWERRDSSLHQRMLYCATLLFLVLFGCDLAH